VLGGLLRACARWAKLLLQQRAFELLGVISFNDMTVAYFRQVRAQAGAGQLPGLTASAGTAIHQLIFCGFARW
jgi:hypothetical protein